MNEESSTKLKEFTSLLAELRELLHIEEKREKIGQSRKLREPVAPTCV